MHTYWAQKPSPGPNLAARLPPGRPGGPQLPPSTKAGQPAERRPDRQLGQGWAFGPNMYAYVFIHSYVYIYIYTYSLSLYIYIHDPSVRPQTGFLSHLEE